MTADPTSAECRLLDALHDRSIPTADIHGPTLTGLLALGLAEITWAGRVRLTTEGRGLFEVCA